MFNSRQILLHCGALGILLALPAEGSLANKPIWSKNAVSFPVLRYQNSRKTRKRECVPFKIVSPDGNSFVQVKYTLSSLGQDSLVTLSVVSGGRVLGNVGTPGFVEDEVVWAPDSKALFITGNSNANTDYHVLVYLLKPPGLIRINPSQAALQDMVQSFPPCRALNASDECQDIIRHPSDWIGTAGIDWVNGSSAIVVMAEMNESSRVGGILGQVLGYELEIPSGKILRRMEPKEFARRWQHSMAWKFRIPDPPEFVNK